MTNDSTPAGANTNNKNKNDGLRHDDPGLAHLKRPYTMSRQEEQDLLEDARRRRTLLLQNDCQEEDWYSRVTYHGVAVSSKKQTDGPFCITRGVCEAPEGFTLDNVRQQFDCDFKDIDSCLRVFARIDPMNLHMCCVTEIQHKDLLEEDSNERLRIL